MIPHINPYAVMHMYDLPSAQEAVLEAMRDAREKAGFNKSDFEKLITAKVMASPYGIDMMQSAADDVSPWTNVTGSLVNRTPAYTQALMDGDTKKAGDIIRGRWLDLIDEAVAELIEDAEYALEEDEAA